MEIGGYFEIELNKNKSYHTKGLKFNYGRYAFEYNWSKVNLIFIW